VSSGSNKAIVRAFIEGPGLGFTRGTHPHFRDDLAHDVVFHTPFLTAEADAADNIHAEAQAYGQALANFDACVDFVIAEDDMVAVHLTGGGDHQRAFLHPAGEVAPTGRPVQASGTVIFRLRDEKITDVWYYTNLHEAIRSGADVPTG
jgi:ketosteroid isomerase-like protein